VVSEEKIFEKVYRWTTDANSSTGELKIGRNGSPTTYRQGSWSIFINVSIQDKRVRVMVFNTTFNNISVISWQ
jgi:hypothetical protein